MPSPAGTRRWQKARWQWGWLGTAGTAHERCWRGGDVWGRMGVTSPLSCPSSKRLLDMALPLPSLELCWCSSSSGARVDAWFLLGWSVLLLMGLCVGQKTGPSNHAWLSTTGRPKNSQRTTGWETYHPSNSEWHEQLLENGSKSLRGARNTCVFPLTPWNSRWWLHSLGALQMKLPLAGVLCWGEPWARAHFSKTKQCCSVNDWKFFLVLFFCVLVRHQNLTATIIRLPASSCC